MDKFWQGFQKRALEVASPVDEWIAQERRLESEVKDSDHSIRERDTRIDPRELQAWYAEGDKE